MWKISWKRKNNSKILLIMKDIKTKTLEIKKIIDNTKENQKQRHDLQNL